MIHFLSVFGPMALVVALGVAALGVLALLTVVNALTPSRKHQRRRGPDPMAPAAAQAAVEPVYVVTALEPAREAA